MNTFLVFDLDNTLYPFQSGLYAYINERMNQFIANHLHVSLSVVDQVRTGYIQQYGTTQEGLAKEHGISPVDFLSFAHDISIEHFLRPNSAFRDYISQLNCPKLIFSNSPIFAIDRILTHLQIKPFFQPVISIESLHYIGKPNPSAFAILWQHLPDKAEKVLFFDDEPKNIERGREFGFTSILVNGKSLPPETYYEQYLIPLLKEHIS